MGANQSHDSTQALKYTALLEKLPATLPVHLRWRLPNPDRIVIDDAPGREDDRKGVDHERGVKGLQISRTQHNGGDKNAGPQRCPGPRPDLVGGADNVGGELRL